MLRLMADQQVQLEIVPVDRFGNPAAVEGAPSWEVEGPLDIEVAEGGMSAVVKTNGTAGTGQVSVTADADLGEGEKPIVGILEVEVLPAEAVAIQINAGTPTPRE